MNRYGEKRQPFYRSDAWLRLIASFKLVKASLLVLAGVAAVELLSDQVVRDASHWAMTLTADRHYEVIDTLIETLLRIDHRTLKLLSLGTFLYAGLFFAEGFGLYLDKRWAEYLTIVTTAGLIPFEIYQLLRHANPAKVGVLVANALIVAYLVLRLSSRDERIEESSEDSARAVGGA